MGFLENLVLVVPDPTSSRIEIFSNKENSMLPEVINKTYALVLPVGFV